MYNVFETEQEAIDAELIDYNIFISHHSNPSAYAEQTKRWAIPRQRLDGKWIYPVCEYGVQTHTQEEYSSEWFPISEEV